MIIRLKTLFKASLFQMATTSRQIIVDTSVVRDSSRPIVIIYGCTGTGKTKLSIQLAKYLNSQVINADAMQLYRGLDIITNKATVDEMSNVKHHLIGYLDPLDLNYTVHQYSRLAIQTVDDLLADNKVPIIVGGTNYYIEAVLWDILITDPDIKSDDGKRFEDDQFYVDNFEFIEDLYSSKSSNQQLYEQLSKIDKSSASTIHPNDRRKVARAIEIYYQHGQPKSYLIDKKNEQDGSGKYHGPLRYKNACILFLNCENEILNKRLDDRIDQMIENGLVNEINTFFEEFKKTSKSGQTLVEYSKQFQHGIFQSIGFKEFNDYLNLSESEKQSENGKKMFKDAVDCMKLVTRRYAKKQLRWVMNRFVKRSNEYSPNVYELDTSDLDKWNENVFEKAKEIVDSFVNKSECKHKPIEKKLNDAIIFEHNFCEICNKTFINKNQWNEHINGRSHRVKVERLNRVNPRVRGKSKGEPIEHDDAKCIKIENTE